MKSFKKSTNHLTSGRKLIIHYACFDPHWKFFLVHFSYLQLILGEYIFNQVCCTQFKWCEVDRYLRHRFRTQRFVGAVCMHTSADLLKDLVPLTIVHFFFRTCDTETNARYVKKKFGIISTYLCFLSWKKQPGESQLQFGVWTWCLRSRGKCVIVISTFERGGTL